MHDKGKYTETLKDKTLLELHFSISFTYVDVHL